MSYQEWRNQIKPNKKIRKYQHIDTPLNLDIEKHFHKVTETISNVKNHQFLPFIKKNDIKIRFRKNAKGELFRKPKIRPIKYASHIDSHIYSYYNFLYMNKYEDYLQKENLSENIIAYRKINVPNTDKGKSNIHFAKEVFDYIYSQDNCVVLTQDIESFFDNINHKLLKEKLCKILAADKLEDSFYKVFRSLTAHKYIEYDDFINKKIKKEAKVNKYAIYKILKDIVKENKKNKGIPQGSPISGLLANIYLIDFDKAIKTSFPKIFYRRYSDDLIFVFKKDDYESFIKFVEEKIQESALSIQPTKSFASYFKKDGENVACEKVTDGSGNFKNRNYVDYLGLEFAGERIFLRKNTIQKLKHKQIIKAKKQLLNILSQRRRKPKKIKIRMSKNNYFKRSLEIINNDGIKKQILKVIRDRNKIKKTNIN